VPAGSTADDLSAFQNDLAIFSQKNRAGTALQQDLVGRMKHNPTAVYYRIERLHWR
jgi:hypothetical protein